MSRTQRWSKVAGLELRDERMDDVEETFEAASPAPSRRTTSSTLCLRLTCACHRAVRLTSVFSVSTYTSGRDWLWPESTSSWTSSSYGLGGKGFDFSVIYDRIGAGTANFWNRVIFDYCMHVNVRYDFIMEEQASQRYFMLQHHQLGRVTMGQWSDFNFKHLRDQNSLHPMSGHHRFVHLLTSHRLYTSGTPDYKVPSHFVLNFPRARM